MAEIRVEKKERRRPMWLWLIPLLLLLALIPLLRRDSDDDTVAAGADTTNAVAAGTVDTGLAATTPATTPAPGAPGVAGAVGTGAAVSQFVSFMGQGNAASDEAGMQQYTADGIRRLADAIQELSTGSSAGAATGASTATPGTAPAPGTPGATGAAGTPSASGTGTIDQTRLQPALENMRQQADSLQRTGSSDDSHSRAARSAFESAATAIGAIATARGTSQPTQVRQAATALRSQGSLLSQKERIQTFFDRAVTTLQSMQTGA